MKIDPMSEDIRRQRRSIIITSLILCLMKYGGIIIQKTTILGSEIKFGNPEVIYLLLWIMWLYFFIRYYQYFMQEGLRKIKITLNSLLTENCRGKIAQIVLDAHAKAQGSSQMYDYNILKKKNFFKILFSGVEAIEPDGMGGEISKAFEMEISLWALKNEVMKSLYTAFFNQSIFTDYIFPIVFALFSLIYCISSEWPGNLINVIKAI